MSVILLELANTGETAQGSGRLISVQDTKVRDSQGKLSVTSLTVAEEHKVTGAVHRLESPLPLLNVKLEHVILVVGPVARRLPDADIIHVGSLNLLVAALAVLRAQKGLEGVEDLGTVGQKEGASWRNLVEEEQLLLLAQLNVVALLGLLQELQVLLHLLLIGESNTADTLQRVVGLVTEEVGGRVL